MNAIFRLNVNLGETIHTTIFEKNREPRLPVDKIHDTFMYSKQQANQILTRKRRSNSGMFEEMRAGDAERECYEEKCNLEEVYEIFDHDKQTTMVSWHIFIVFHRMRDRWR